MSSQPTVSPQEQVLLRLFRCMDASERSESLTQSVRTLASRRSLDPLYRRHIPEDMEAEREEDLGGRLMGLWPGAADNIDLDAVGDPGYWLEVSLGEPVTEILFGQAWDDETTAAALADSYVCKLEERHLPLPSDFDAADEETDDRAYYQEKFVRFLQNWREKAVALLEAQNVRPAE